MKLKISLISPHKGPRLEVVELGSVLVGRSSESDLIIRDLGVSRRHARLYLEAQKIMLADLGSTRGTWVNGTQIQAPVEVGPGTSIRFGTQKGHAVSEIIIQGEEIVKEEAGMAEQTLFRSAQTVLDSNTVWQSQEEVLENYAKRLRQLSDLQDALARATSLQALCGLVLDQTFTLLGPESASISLKQEDHTYQILASRGGKQGEPFISETLLHEMTAKGMAVLAQDTRSDLRFAEAVSIQAAGVRSLVASPLFEGDQNYGLVVVTAGGGRAPFTEKDMSWLVSLAAITTLRLRNIILSEENERYLRERNRVLEEMVEDRTRELTLRNEELQRKNQEIARAQNQLVISEKMASLGNLTAGVAHEINNPNNFILGGSGNLATSCERFRELLFSLIGDEADLEIETLFSEFFAGFTKQIGIIREGSQRITQIVNSLQLVSRHDEAVVERINLRGPLEAAVLLLQPNYDDWVEVTLECEGSFYAECWQAQLSMVFLNLIDNGCRAVQARVEKMVDKKKGRVHISARREGSNVVLCFEDQGLGMDGDFLKKIFDPFFTTRDPGSGTGLGLYTCYNIIEKHGGSISVTSEQGEGSLFTMVLPLWDATIDNNSTEHITAADSD